MRLAKLVLTGWAAATCAVGPLAAAEQAPRAVIELFTSQGCSSCPPADALFDRISADPSIIALTFPVDYWDYLGWKDTFARPDFTARQAAWRSCSTMRPRAATGRSIPRKPWSMAAPMRSAAIRRRSTG